MYHNTKHRLVSRTLAETLNAAVLGRDSHSGYGVEVASPIVGFPGYGIFVQTAENADKEKGFDIYLRQNFSEETLGQGHDLFYAFAPADNFCEALMDSLDKVVTFLEDSFRYPAKPLPFQGPFEAITKEYMQPLLDALNRGDFKLAAELTPVEYRLVGYQEFQEDRLEQRYGFGWAGQFEDTQVPAGRYPVFACKYTYNERAGLYTNQLKDFQGLEVMLFGQCVADSHNSKPDAYPYDNVVIDSPYCHAAAHSILDGNSWLHLIPPFKAETVHFKSVLNGEELTSYKIVDTSLPEYMHGDPMGLRKTADYIRKSSGLSHAADYLYRQFRGEYRSCWQGYGNGSMSVSSLSRHDYFSVDALNELIVAGKVQPCAGKSDTYELTADERLDLLESRQVYLSQNELKWKPEYERCRKEAQQKPSLSAQIQKASAHGAVAQNEQQGRGALPASQVTSKKHAENER